MTLAGLSQKGFQQPENKIFLQGEEVLHYGTLVERIEKLTNYYYTHDVKLGEIVFLAVSEPARFAELFISLLVNGIGVVVINPQSTKTEAQCLLTNTQANYLIVDEQLIQDWSLSTNKLLLSVSRQRPTGLLGKMLGKRALQPQISNNSYPHLLSEIKRKLVIEPSDNSSIGYIVNTSGTTSSPKNVLASRRSYLHTLKCRSEKFQIDENSRVHNILSLAHGDGIAEGPLLNFYNGSTWIRPHEFKQQNLATIVDAVYTHKVTHLFLVPTLMSLIMRLGKDYYDCLDYDHLRVIVSTSALLPESLWRKFEETFNVEISNLYSLTECTVGLFSGPDQQSRKIGSIGKPFGSEIRIINCDGETVNTNDVGELLIKSDSLMDGYVNNPEETAACINNGWLKTGDIAKQDNQGFVTIVGRIKHMISFAGHSINPMEIVETLETHPQVQEAAVIAIDHAEWGEFPIAIVVAETNNTVDEVDLIEHCRTHLSEFKIPREIVLTDSLPKTPSGKLDTKKLTLLYESFTKPISNDLQSTIFTLAQHCFRSKQTLTTDDSPLTVSGWDSLAHMQLILETEKAFEIKFSTKEIMTLENLGGLISLVKNKSTSD